MTEHEHTHTAQSFISQVIVYTQTSPGVSDMPAPCYPHLLSSILSTPHIGSHLPVKSYASVSSTAPDKHPTHRSSQDNTHGPFGASTQPGTVSLGCWQVVPTSSYPPPTQLCIPSLLPEPDSKACLLAGLAKIVRRLMMCLKRGEKKRHDLENISRIWKQTYDIWSVRDPFVTLMLLNTAWWRKHLAGLQVLFRGWQGWGEAA